MRSFFPAVVLAPLVLACGAAPSSAEETAEASSATTARYVDVLDYWVDAPQDAWLSSIDNVVHQFNQICGDTFCGGDYSDLTALELACSVSPVRGNLHACTWTFAGSLQVVDAASGYIYVSKPTYACKFSPTGTVAALRDFFNQPNSLQAPLPGLDTSLYDVIGECFQHPIGATSTPAPGSGPYTDALDAVGGGWSDVMTAVNSTFPSLCDPNGLCVANRPWLQPLTFNCSVNVKSGALAKCMWTFGEGGATVTPSTGTIHTTQSTRYCMVPATGSASDLMTLLTASGSTDPLHRKLPGGSKTLASVLSACLD